MFCRLSHFSDEMCGRRNIENKLKYHILAESLTILLTMAADEDISAVYRIRMGSTHFENYGTESTGFNRACRIVKIEIKCRLTRHAKMDEVIATKLMRTASMTNRAGSPPAIILGNHI